ncbi:phospholipid carrier-dependent glycosyltransferase, partial [archaeon]|nr:phospholipid carrier-dependent glycosyltransferase [archaeon]
MPASRRFFDETASALSPLILATSGLFFLASHKMIIDIGLVFFVSASMCSFFTAYREKSRSWYRVFWICLALSFLTKGVIGLAIPAAGIFLFILWKRDFSALKQAWPIQGALLVLAVMAGWGYILYERGGYDYLYEFYVYNQIGRFIPMGGDIYQGGHHRPFYAYLTGIWVQAAPWSFLLIPAAARMKKFTDSEKFMWSWLMGGLLLLSLASTKREIYLLPMYPAMSMIVASWMSRMTTGRIYKWEDRFLLAVTALIISASIFLPLGYLRIGGSWHIAAGLSIAAGCLFTILWKKYREKEALPYFAVVGWSLIIIIWTPAVFPVIDREKSYKEIFITMGNMVSRDRVAGYHLTETVEALSSFYGGFDVKNIEDRTDLI